MAAPFYPVNLAGVPTSGVLQVETATVVGDITAPGDAEVIVTAAGMSNSPKTFAVPLGGVLQQETATVVGTITADGDAEVIVTANGMTGSPKTVAVAVDDGVAQVETATVVGTITGGGDAEVIVTANGLTGSPVTVPVAVDDGTAQVETATVVGTIEPAGAGNAEVIVTAAGMTGSPKTIPVAVANDDTASDVAGKIRTALIADADVGDPTTGFFTVTGADENIILTAKVKAANDATLNISIDNDTCAGLTAAPTSANTTAGVAPDDADAVAGKIRAALALVTAIDDFFTISGSDDDVVLTVKANAANDATLNISIDNDTCTGLTAAPTSANTTAGVAPDTAAGVATKIRAALIADADVGDPSTGFFTVTGSGADVVLTANVAAANDPTMNISIDNDTCAGLTAAPTSTDTTSGGAGATAAEVAAEIRAALAADADVAAFFTVGGSGATVVLTRLRSAANDATMNIAIDNDTCEGLTPAATSANTTAGVHGTYRGVDAGQKLVDTTNGHLYENTGDVDRPVWTLA